MGMGVYMLKKEMVLDCFQKGMGAVSREPVTLQRAIFAFNSVGFPVIYMAF